MYPNRYASQQNLSNEKIAELVTITQKQTYLEKQIQIESLEREREATLHLLNDVQKTQHAHSPRPSKERSALLEEARRRQKERALLGDQSNKATKKYLDGTEEKEPALSLSRFSEDKNPRYISERDYSLPEQKSQQIIEKQQPIDKDIRKNPDESYEFKLFIDQEYMQLKQELENLRKGPKTIETIQKKPFKTTPVSKSYKKEPEVLTQFKEKPTRDIEIIEDNYVVSKPQRECEIKTTPPPNNPRKTEEIIVKPQNKAKMFKVESSSMDIVPEASRKSPIGNTRKSQDIETSKNSVKKKDVPEMSIQLQNSNLNIAAIEPVNNPMNTFDTPLSMTSSDFAPKPGPNRASWNLETPYQSQPVNMWNNNYNQYNPYPYPYPTTQVYPSAPYYQQPPVAYNYPYNYTENRYQYANPYNAPPQYYSTNEYPNQNYNPNPNYNQYQNPNPNMNSSYNMNPNPNANSSHNMNLSPNVNPNANLNTNLNTSINSSIVINPNEISRSVESPCQRTENILRKINANNELLQQTDIFDDEDEGEIINKEYKDPGNRTLQAEEVVKPVRKAVWAKSQVEKDSDNFPIKKAESEKSETKDPSFQAFEDEDEPIENQDSSHIKKSPTRKTSPKIQSPPIENISEPPIEIKKPVLLEFGSSPNKSLAEMFKEKNKNFVSQLNIRDQQAIRQDHKQKTKEELLEIRKNLVKAPKIDQKKSDVIEIQIEEKKSNKEPSSALMERLATGQRVKVTKEEMRKLNKKNYQMLPEVRKKQEEDQKRLEKQQRIQKAKEFERVRVTQTKQDKRPKPSIEN
ncbi:hypothetical protein SteCoe_6078 [Stentor coeruleus]|uniref:Uncharacterized protein n=1 Tax=Stentor coeruleus TaxID=5963 RepID=A0A1R2CQV5_9CILI|nr:hypothetical protein SteCoe_6078 [Stentor coeruleus]